MLLRHGSAYGLTIMCWHRAFRKELRTYNNCFQMASASLQEAAMPAGVSNFKIGGNFYHRMGPLLPDQGAAPAFVQTFLYDQDAEQQATARLRGTATSRVDRQLLLTLQNMLHRCNNYVRELKAVAAAHTGTDVRDLRVVLQVGPGQAHSPGLDAAATASCNVCRGLINLRVHAEAAPAGAHQGRYNAPTANQVAILMPGDGAPAAQAYDLELNLQGGGVRKLNTLDSHFEPLHFVLLFPHGTQGFVSKKVCMSCQAAFSSFCSC